MTTIYQHDFTLLQGATLDKSFTFQSAGSPVNLTGYTARMQLRATVDAVSPLLDMTNANGKIILGSGTGNIRLLVSATDTAALNFSTAVYDLELVTAGGVVRRLLRGTVTLDKEVTR